VRGEIFGIEQTKGNYSKDFEIESIGGDSNLEVSINKYGVATYTSSGNKTIYYFNQIRKGFLRIDYSDFSQAFSLTNLCWFFSEILNQLIGLLLLFS